MCVEQDDSRWKKTPVKENEGVFGWVFGGTWQFLPRKEKKNVIKVTHYAFI